MYVVDTDNNRIEKFSPDGKFLDQFCWGSSGPGQLKLPYGIVIDTVTTGLVYVSDCGNHCVSVFTRDGVFVSSFGSKGSNIDQFNYPFGLTFDKKQLLYFCDFNNNRLVVY